MKNLFVYLYVGLFCNLVMVTNADNNTTTVISTSTSLSSNTMPLVNLGPTSSMSALVVLTVPTLSTSSKEGDMKRSTTVVAVMRSSTHAAQVATTSHNPSVPSGMSPTRSTWSSVPSSTSLASSPATPTKPNKKSEPEVSLYVWQIVIIAAGVVILAQLIIITMLCMKNRSLKDKLKIRGTYSVPIKDNGAWIDNTNIPLWQKRASTYVQENPAVVKDTETEETKAREEISYH